MSPSKSRKSKRSRKTGKSKINKEATCGPYDHNFEQKLNDHNIWLIPLYEDTMPANHEFLKERLKATRPSDSTTELSILHKDFLKKNDSAGGSQDSLFDSVIRTIQGNVDCPFARNRLFNNMRLGVPFKDARPDHYEGVHPNDVCYDVRKELSAMIIPTTTRTTKDPAAPNYFLEVKTPNLSGEIARMQACHSGILGARGIHRLQNFRSQPQLYDGNAYTFSVIYHNLTLTIFATYLTPPSRVGEKERYDITEVESYYFKREGDFVDGVIACRNIRDLAKEFREKFVREANERAIRTVTQALSISSNANDESDEEPMRSARADQDDGSFGDDLDDESGWHSDGHGDGEGQGERPGPAVVASQAPMPSFEGWTSRLRLRRRREVTPDEDLPRKKRR